jgi:BirA family transcriptional regulator, biotin operon repressor / biotin---[acetyl-CoA-carboxylase] ligase
VAHTASTNTRLIERASSAHGRRAARASGDTQPGELHGRRAGDLDPCLLVAEHQTSGRGRLGRTWYSSAGASLTFSVSLLLKPPDWPALSLAVGVALADALDPQRTALAPRLRLKWPNDILLAEASSADPAGARKLAGVLVETVPVAERRMAVVGVGINVQPLSAADTTWGKANLQEIEPGITAPAALARVARPLVEALLRYEREGFAPFRAGFTRRDLLAGQAVSTSAATWPEGVAEGVDESGALLLRVGSVQHRISSGDVSLRLSGSGIES